MKLIDKEPTQEMITAMSRTYTSLKEMFRAAYDTAPAMEQEPFGYVREIRPMEWKFSKTTSWGPEVWKPVFTFPIDAQAEIAKRDARIAELIKECERFRQEALCAYLDDEESIIAKQALRIKELEQARGICPKCACASDFTLTSPR